MCLQMGGGVSTEICHFFGGLRPLPTQTYFNQTFLVYIRENKIEQGNIRHWKILALSMMHQRAPVDVVCQVRANQLKRTCPCVFLPKLCFRFLEGGRGAKPYSSRSPPPRNSIAADSPLPRGEDISRRGDIYHKCLALPPRYFRVSEGGIYIYIRNNSVCICT